MAAYYIWWFLANRKCSWLSRLWS